MITSALHLNSLTTKSAEEQRHWLASGRLTPWKNLSMTDAFASPAAVDAVSPLTLNANLR